MIDCESFHFNLSEEIIGVILPNRIFSFLMRQSDDLLLICVQISSFNISSSILKEKSTEGDILIDSEFLWAFSV